MLLRHLTYFNNLLQCSTILTISMLRCPFFKNRSTFNFRFYIDRAKCGFAKISQQQSSTELELYNARSTVQSSSAAEAADEFVTATWWCVYRADGWFPRFRCKENWYAYGKQTKHSVKPSAFQSFPVSLNFLKHFKMQEGRSTELPDRAYYQCVWSNIIQH